VTKDDMEIVSALRIALAGKVGKERFALWFGSSARFAVEGRTLSITVPNRFFLEWIRASFRRHIDEACIEVLGQSAAVSFHLDANLPDPQAEPQSAPQQPAPPTHAAAQPPAAPLRVVAADDAAAPDAASAAGNGNVRRKFTSLESFVAGDGNKMALAAAESAVRRPGQWSPLFLYGPTSVGKTHLLEGIWTAAQKSRKLHAVYLSAEQFTTYFLEALRGSGLPNFRRKYRGVGLLILDDLQFLAGKRATLVELLYTVDTLIREGKQLVFAADRSPAELTELGPELLTRLQSGMLCRIEPADQATRSGIVAQMARRMNLAVPPDVQEFLATRLTSHARELSGALCRLQAAGEALGQPITRAMAEEELAEMIRHSGRVVRLGDIEKAVCDVFGLEPACLQSGEKGQRVSHPRMLAMWLARKHTRAALSEIGRFFGRRSHSTVVSAQKRVDTWMAAGAPLRLCQRDWSADEAVRQVERRLAAG
jgi:chromosomal replication initiator protein